MSPGKQDERIQVYTTTEVLNQIDTRAEEAGMSRSEYCHQLFRDYHDDGLSLEQISRYTVGQRMEEALQASRDDILAAISELQADSVPDLEHIQSLRTMYVLSLWELLKQDYSPEQREQAMRNAALKLNDMQSETRDSDELEPPESSAYLAPEH